jgi:glycosyltransferase involved in cell wall biosynthesis
LVNKFKISRGKIKVIPNGLDDLKKKGYKEEAKIGFIGGLNRQKGVDVLIDAYKKIIKSHSSLKLEIMGDGPLREKMKKRAKWAKDRINFLGLRSDIAPILSSWKILIVPSRSESFGQVVIEAAMLSKPVVATNVGGLPEVVGDNITGLLVNNDNPDALARAVIYLLARPKKIKIMGIKARKRFEKFFTAERMIAEIEKVYKKILEIK